MLRFDKMELENFGPYQGNKVVDFGTKDGVIIVWGNNGFGKTTLLNAFKYVLFGKVVGRGNNEMSKRQMINWKSYENGNYSFRITLHFSADNSNYKLIREYKLANSNLPHEEENSYKDFVSLWKDGAILSPSATQHELNKIMPEQVSRFFLFDGELLKEYEELLHTEKGIGQKIKSAIEEILGVPLLSNALVDINTQRDHYEQLLSEAASKDSQQKARGEALSRANSQLEVYNAGLSKLRSDESTYLTELQKAQGEQSKYERIKELIDDITHLKELIEDRKAKILEKKEKIKELSATSWKVTLLTILDDLILKMKERVAELDDKNKKHLTAVQILEWLESSKAQCTCAICEAELDVKRVELITSKIDSFSSNFAGLTESEVRERDSLSANIRLLSSAITTNTIPTITMCEDDICDYMVDIADAEQRIKELQKDVDDYSKQKAETDEIAKRIAKYSDLLANTRTGISDILLKIAEQEELIKKAKAALLKGNSSGEEFKIAQNNSSFCSDLRDLFEDSLETYRDYLKQQVEEDATKIFLNLSNDPKLSGLKINDNYGLEIVHEEGKIVTVRSAGFEHIVALSLIGALHNNAPLQGPVVMDSPFGRLDSEHERNIITYLPNLANQVMLFVFDKEINEQRARVILGSNLVEEFMLRRGATFETKIERK